MLTHPTTPSRPTRPPLQGAAQAPHPPCPPTAARPSPNSTITSNHHHLPPRPSCSSTAMRYAHQPARVPPDQCFQEVQGAAQRIASRMSRCKRDEICDGHCRLSPHLQPEVNQGFTLGLRYVFTPCASQICVAARIHALALSLVPRHCRLFPVPLAPHPPPPTDHIRF